MFIYFSIVMTFKPQSFYFSVHYFSHSPLQHFGRSHGNRGSSPTDALGEWKLWLLQLVNLDVFGFQMTNVDFIYVFVTHFDATHSFFQIFCVSLVPKGCQDGWDSWLKAGCDSATGISALKGSDSFPEAL